MPFKLEALALTTALFGLATAQSPTKAPTKSPTKAPTNEPTKAPTQSPTPGVWSLTGCPKVYSSGSAYASGDAVSVNMGTYQGVFVCVDGANSAFCSQSAYSPDGQYSSTAWNAVGSCSGTVSPTSSPNYVTIGNAGGCPSDYVSGATYAAGDKVTKGGLVYQCKDFPESLWCSSSAYEPGSSLYWTHAWDIKGYCSGTVAPTTSPNFSTLVDMGGCPAAWVENALGATAYEEGDLVSDGKVVYECKAWPFSGHCGQSGYQPGSADSDAWKDAWTVKGFCSGTIAPTASPQINPTNSIGGCPATYSSTTTYEEGDIVSVVVSTSPEVKVTYRCKAWPLSEHCSTFAPDDEIGGALGWMPNGPCQGTIAPTATPSFDALAPADSAGCPEPYQTSNTFYTAGERVSVVIAGGAAVDAATRAVVYKCKAWPATGYCNQGEGFTPGTTYGNMAWDLVGACVGSMTPTQAPTPYNNVQEQCVYTKVVETPTTQACSPGSSPGCTCTGTPPTQTCQHTVDVPTPTTTVVNNWSNSVEYDENDVVRIGRAQYKCKPWPYMFWCRMEVYKPTLAPDGLWKNAWTKLDDVCPDPPPSASPTISSMPSESTAPSLSPSEMPSSSPSEMPSGMPSSQPSETPSSQPSETPSGMPSSQPSETPSSQPSETPSS